MKDVTLTLTRDEVTEIKRLLIKEARWVMTSRKDPFRHTAKKEADDLHKKIHDQI